MQPFSPPPLKILVHKLDGVEDRPFNHKLTPADIRKDAFYQKLARRNAALEWRLRHIRALVGLTATIVIALNVLYLAPWTQAHKQVWLDQAFAWMFEGKGGYGVNMPVGTAAASTTNKSDQAAPKVAAVPAVMASEPVATASAPSTPTMPQAVASAPVVVAQAVTAPAQPVTTNPQQPDAANQLAAAIRALIDQQGAKPAPPIGSTTPPAANSRPITVVPGITTQKPAVAAVPSPAAQREPLPVHESAPLKATSPLSIIDFFGANTAVLLSSDGGQTMRSYRVGDALQSGEVIKAIDSVNGSVTTNQRIIKKQEPK